MFRPRDPALFWVNVAGIVVALMFAAYCWFAWTHPDYVPPCMSTYKARCPAVIPSR